MLIYLQFYLKCQKNGENENIPLPTSLYFYTSCNIKYQSKLFLYGGEWAQQTNTERAEWYGHTSAVGLPH